LGEAVLNDSVKDGVVDQMGRFVQGIGYLTEWVKHIVTIGSALMVLEAALLKDLVKGVGAPYSYIIASSLVLSYVAMLVALWKCLAFTRRTASSVLTSSGEMPPGDELQSLRTLLDYAQAAFLVAVALFAVMACTALVVWAVGLASSTSPTTAVPGRACIPA
jgi:hypothetical protein